jgi:hypothetical protein
MPLPRVMVPEQSNLLQEVMPAPCYEKEHLILKSYLYVFLIMDVLITNVVVVTLASYLGRPEFKSQPRDWYPE